VNELDFETGCMAEARLHELRF